MKKIIVVTGGAGFIGSNLINLIIKKTKFNIISIDNYSSGKKINHIKKKMGISICICTRTVYGNHGGFNAFNSLLNLV